MKMNNFAVAMVSFVLATGYGYAQERAATGSMEAQVTWTALSNMVKSAEDKVTAVNTRVDQVVVCGRKGFVYAPGQAGADADGCLVPAGQASLAVTQVRGLGSSSATATCPTGTILVGCAGSRSPSFADSCDERDCGMVGAGPINSRSCRTAIDTDSGTQATAWAFCLSTN